jgi:hypothetical protein
MAVTENWGLNYNDYLIFYGLHYPNFDYSKLWIILIFKMEAIDKK